jgi:hypothetical protein
MLRYRNATKRSILLRLYNLKLVIYVGRVLLVSQVPSILQLVGGGLVVFLDTAFAVPTECVTAEVGVVCV